MNFLSLFVLIPLVMLLGLWLARDVKGVRAVMVTGSTLLLILAGYLTITFLGDRADAHDRRAIHLMVGGGLGDRHLLAYQLQPYLVLLRRAQEPLRATVRAVATRVCFGHDQILQESSENPSDVV